MSNTKIGWYIWSFEHNAWWGHGRRGYVQFIDNAGVYSFTEAVEIVVNANAFGDINEAMIPATHEK